MNGIVDVSLRSRAIKRGPVVRVERYPQPKPLNEIGIRDKVTTEGHKIDLSFIEDLHGSFPIKAARGDHRPFEDLAKTRRRYGRMPVVQGLAAFDTWLNDVEICQPEAIERTCDIVENHIRIAVGYPIEDAAGREPDPDAVRTENFGHGLDDFDKKPGAVFDRAAIGIRAQIGPVLQELIEEIPPAASTSTPSKPAERAFAAASR